MSDDPVRSTTVPNSIMTRPDLSPTHRLLFILLLMYEQKGEQPSRADLARLLGENSHTVQIYLDELKAAKLVEERGAGNE
jgi:Mn-dependent DtxR family transcriptional regulator